MAKPILRAVAQDVEPQEFLLDDEPCTLGRSRNCHIMINQSTISRLHAKVESTGDYYTISDLGSANGTFVGGKLISGPQLLIDGIMIGLGSNAPLLTFIDPDATERSADRLVYDERANHFRIGDKVLVLAPTPQRLLHYLYSHHGEVCRHERCISEVWGVDPESDPQLRAMLFQEIHEIRKAIKQATNGEQELLRNVRGAGYCLDL